MNKSYTNATYFWYFPEEQIKKKHKHNQSSSRHTTPTQTNNIHTQPIRLEEKRWWKMQSE